MTPHEVLFRPVLSEKALSGVDSGKYAFYVHPKANRTQIKDAVEQVFEVEVVKINVSSVRGKVKTMGRYKGRRPERKKAVVTLKDGQRIQELEGLT